MAVPQISPCSHVTDVTDCMSAMQSLVAPTIMLLTVSWVSPPLAQVHVKQRIGGATKQCTSIMHSYFNIIALVVVLSKQADSMDVIGTEISAKC